MRPTLLAILFCAAAFGINLLSSTSVQSQYANGQAYPATTVVPYYASVFTPGSGQQAEDNRQMIALLKSIDGRLANLETKSGFPAPVSLKADPFPIAAQKCASCHAPAAADGKGGGFILFATDEVEAFRPLSTRDKARIKEAVQNGDMPPAGKGKLTADEKKAFDW